MHPQPGGWHAGCDQLTASVALASAHDAASLAWVSPAAQCYAESKIERAPPAVERIGLFRWGVNHELDDGRALGQVMCEPFFHRGKDPIPQRQALVDGTW